MNEFPSGHLNFIPEIEVPNIEDLQLAAWAEDVENISEAAINATEVKITLSFIPKGYSLQAVRQGFSMFGRIEL